jgi:hypothetical protein
LLVEQDNDEYEIHVDLRDLNFLIRNSKDPLLYARNITSGSMNFNKYFNPNQYIVIGVNYYINLLNL